MLNYIALLIPLFLVLIALEWRYSLIQNDNRYKLSNTAINMAIGAMDQVGALAYLAVFYFALNFSKTHFEIFHLPNDWRQWLLAAIVIDFVSYWYHRFSHRNHLLWAGHVTHHSSNHFNFSNGFRTSPFQGLFRIPFYLPLPMLGFDPLILVVTFKVTGLWDFLVHTSYINKLGPLETVFVTPSHHRVHHGKNECYIDKNYGSILIIWDKLFGTFQEEKETVVYGVKSDYQDSNPVNAIFYHFRWLIKTCITSTSWKNRLKIWFMPPEWTPTDTAAMSTTVLTPHKTLKKARFYGYYLLSTGTVGFIWVLFCYDTLQTDIAIYLFLLVVSQIIQAAISLQETQHPHFLYFECLRWLSFALFGLMIFHPWPLIQICVFLLCCLSVILLSLSSSSP